MKTLKQYIKEATVGKPSGPSTIHQDTVEDGVISAANIHDAETLKKVNAFVGAIGDGEYLTPQAAIHGLREKLMRIGLQFGDVETPGKNGTATVEVMQFGGRTTVFDLVLIIFGLNGLIRDRLVSNLAKVQIGEDFATCHR